MTQNREELIERLRHMVDNHHAIKDSAAIQAAISALTEKEGEIEKLRRETIEECANLIEARFADPGWQPLLRTVANSLAASIRSLQGEKGC